MRRTRRIVTWIVAPALLFCCAADAVAGKKKQKPEQDPYADYVWPPPPDKARIKLEDVIHGRADVVARSSFKRKLLGNSPQTGYDSLRKPFAVTYDNQGRILVTDSATAALIRFDRVEHRMDVLGTRGAVRLKVPLGVHVGSDDTIYVADVGIKRVLALDSEGDVVNVYGHEGELVNPTDALPTRDGERLYVADSKAHKVVVFDLATGNMIASHGRRGEGQGEFSWPTSLAWDPEGNLLVVDQINCRVQLLDAEGHYLDEFGGRGVGYGNFVRPKDVAVDENGYAFVTDNAFNNVQLFDADFTILTFIGEKGTGPGRFHGVSGIAVHGNEFAVVDQLGQRLQIFRLLDSATD